ncbi:MAG: Hpt domain-containing protein [Pseudomonadota bacterium]
MPPDASPPYADAATRDILDVAEGMERIMGDRQLYTRMLTRFRSDYAGGSGPVQCALAAADDELAHRLVHTLKGASGMIGAQRLHHQADVLERALRTGSGTALQELGVLATELLSVMRVIDTLLAGTAAAPADAPALMPDAELLAHLEALLASGDGAAVDLFEASGASLLAILGQARLDEVGAAIGAFDFDVALQTLQRDRH